MNLAEVKWRRCECSKSFPNAHYKPHGTSEGTDVYKQHKNMRCSPCMRKDLAVLKKMDRLTEADRKRVKLLERMLP